ncbi:serine/threonine-protein kinase-like protein At3g51990 [Selaginella moellendorffii]|nr:serine/threonine-protein kinase-like protein At3g51990 [Selaginella moellendorffii]|eukprot:XP_024542974.1 serine/threonine-protein kinase-like protein At3g51990 [Selaginella moellendorffii]
MVHLSCKTESAVITCKAHKDDIEPAKLKTFRYKDLEAATGGFAREFLLGKGSYGWVYKGCLRDGKLVAVKRSSLARKNSQDDNPLDNELEILSKIRSTRLVNLVGYSRDNKETVLVVDYMANGTLHDILHCRNEPLSWSIRVQVALQIAKGLRALHSASPPVIHRDIKSSNVLIDADWNARLADFGLALRGRIEDVIRLSTPPAGTMGYLDPGYVSPGHLSTKTDVFSFGILLLEIMSGRNAIDVQYYPPNIVDWALPLIKQGKGAAICDPKSKHPTNAEALNEMAGVAARCVRLSSSRRPTMAEVVKELREISKRIQMPIWNSIVKPLKSSLDLAAEGYDQWKLYKRSSLLEVKRKLESKKIVNSSSASSSSAASREGSSCSSLAIGDDPCMDPIVKAPGTRRARVRMIYAEDKLKLDVNKTSKNRSNGPKMGDFLLA